jgi:competence protein ComEA
MRALAKFWRDGQAVERVIIIVSTTAIVFFGGWLWRAENQVSTLPPLFEDVPVTKSPIPKASSVSGTQNGNRRVTVPVVGAVNKPQVLTLPSQERVKDAIIAAGGAAKNADANALNLASRLEDGQQIRVPTRQEAQQVAKTQGSGVAFHQPCLSMELPY